ncbi:hypothetical protein [Cellulomonas sp. NPDC058312]|uniref:hypothetical protein n=1 Tax=Cellulomonas sp. NPDC058312 TaxID=3346441 RepID=UPI0036F11426
MITVLCCRGIGEGRRENLLSDMTRRLDPWRFRAREVPWQASYGPVPDPWGSAFDAALYDGRNLLLEMIRHDPYPVVLAGYSGGGALAGNVAAEIGRGEHPDLDVRGVGLVSDPLRSLSSTVNPGAEGWGIAGRRYIPRQFPVWHLADPTDVITCCPPHSPLRTIADQSAAFSLADPAAWGGDLIDRLKTKRWQEVKVDWMKLFDTFAQYRQAQHDAEGYLFRGDHTSYATRRVPGSTRTYTQWLADRINEIGSVQ